MGVTKVEVRHEDFSLEEEMAALRRQDQSAGAAVSFVGVVRNRNQGDRILALELEHYPGMTESAIRTIVSDARKRWEIEDAVVIHRVGRLAIGEQIVLCLVTSEHRGEAFSACEFIMDWLKTEAPFWKREQTPKGLRWVEARESDERSRDRWKTPGQGA